MTDIIIKSLELPMKVVLKSIPDNPRKILDLGSGKGKLTYYLSQIYPNAEVVGIDGDSNYIKFSTSQYNSPNLKFEYCLFNDISETEFDVIIFCGVIEHLPNVGETLNVINKILAEDGVFFVTTDNAHNIKFILAHIFYSLFKRKPDMYLWHNQEGRYIWWAQHIYSWTLSSLVTLLHLYGFELVEFWYSDNGKNKKISDKFFFLIGQLIPALRNKMIIKCKKVSSPTILEMEVDESVKTKEQVKKKKI